VKKITLIRRAYSPSGGAEKYLLRLADGLTHHGWTPQLVTAADWPSDVWTWGNIQKIPGSSPMEFANAFKNLTLNQDLGVTFSLERVWEANFYRAGDGVHQAWLDRLARHSSPLSNLARKTNRKHKEILQLERSLYAPPSRTQIIANSQLVAQEISQIYGTNPDSIRVIHNGYDAPTQDAISAEEIRQTTRQQLSISDNETLVLFVGSGWKRKGAYPAIDAMRHLKGRPIKLVIAGKGKPPKKAPNNVIFLGEVRDVAALYRAADLFLLPTLYDPFSNATLEAACFGLPVITSRDNGFCEPLSRYGGGSILNDPTDAQEIANAIQTWQSEELQAKAKQQLADLAAHHTQEINIQQTLDLILTS